MMDSEPRSYAAFHRQPRISASAFVADSADLIGDVTVGEESSIWFQCVLRGDINGITLGNRTNLQDGSVIHVADRFGTRVGDWVTVGHRAILHACTIEDEVLVGMGAVVMDGAVIGRGSIVAAGSVVTAGTEVPPGSLVMGLPGRVKRSLSEEEREEIRVLAQRYVATTREYLKRGRK